MTQPSKCAKFSTDGATRTAMARADGPPVCLHFKDLGVEQCLTQVRDATLDAERDSAALAKMGSVQAVALNFRWRCRLVAGSAIPTAMYGAEAPPMPVERLALLQAAAKAAAWRSGVRAAPEIIACVLGPRRADLMAVATTKPWMAIRNLI